MASWRAIRVGPATTFAVSSLSKPLASIPTMSLDQSTASISITKPTTYQERLCIALSKMRDIVEHEAKQSGDYVRTRRRHFVDDDGTESDLTIFRVEGAPATSQDAISDSLVNFLSSYEDVDICKDIAIEIL
jgi:hypothetical protein